MNNPEKPKNQEWLNNPDERKRRFGSLGLSGNQNYSELSREEKHFLNLKEDERRFIRNSATIINNKYDDEEREYIGQFMEVYDDLSSAFTSPGKSQTSRLNLALTDAIMSLGIPVEVALVFWALSAVSEQAKAPILLFLCAKVSSSGVIKLYYYS